MREGLKAKGISVEVTHGVEADADGNLPATLAHIRSGKLVALGLTDTVRSPVAPDIATLAEQGVAGVVVTSWYGLLAPAGTPMDIVNRIQQESAKAMGTPVLKERLLSQGAVPSGITSAEFARMIESEMRKWAQVVKASGATVD